MTYQIVLLFHLLGATVWTGGHLVLAITILPRALRRLDPRIILDFESGYEKLGIPALLIQVITGLWLAHRYVPEFSRWFVFDTALSTYVAIKVILLIATLLLALDARLRIVPRLDQGNLWSLAYHIIGTTVLSVLFLAAGVGIRTGGF